MELILCSTVVSLLIYGGSSHLVPESVVSSLIQEGMDGVQRYKRQTSDVSTQILQCISDKLDATFQGNTASFVSECKSVTASELQLDDLANAQEQIFRFYRVYCGNRECGTAVNEAYTKCGVYSISPPGTEALNIDLCGTNQDGTPCYKLYADGLTLTNAEANCYKSYLVSGVCTCQSALSEAVESQKCCLSAYHDLVSGLGPIAYKPSVLYDACGVSRSAGCNNSPLAASDSSPGDSTSPTSSSEAISSSTTTNTSSRKETISYGSAVKIVVGLMLISALALSCTLLRFPVTFLPLK